MDWISTFLTTVLIPTSILRCVYLEQQILNYIANFAYQHFIFSDLLLCAAAVKSAFPMVAITNRNCSSSFMG